MITCYRVAPKEAYMTGLAGYLRISKSLLRDLIGKPDGYASGDGKVCEHYTLKVGGVVATIYDYKTGYKRLPMSFNDWHIGGVQGAPFLLAQWLREKGFNVDVSDEASPTVKVN